MRVIGIPAITESDIQVTIGSELNRATVMVPPGLLLLQDYFFRVSNGLVRIVLRNTKSRNDTVHVLNG